MFLGQAIDVRRVFHQALLEEHGGPLLPQPVNVHRPAADEVGEPAERLGRAGGVRAIAHRLPLRAHHLAAAGGASLGHDEPPLPTAALAGHRPHDLRDDVSGPLHDHRVADADVLAADVVLVVQRRLLDDDAAHLHRLQHGEGVEAAGAPHVDGDLQQLRRRLDGRELVGHGPARLSSHVAQPLLQRQPVDLHHQAVDLVLQVVALLHPLLVVAVDLLQMAAAGDVGVDAEAEVAQPVERLQVAVRPRSVLQPAKLVDPDVQPPGRRHAGVELAHGAGGGVAGVGEQWLAQVRPLVIESLKGGLGHVDLAPYLKAGWDFAVPHLHGDAAHSAQVLGDVLPSQAVAPRGPLHEAPALVDQRHRQAVDLGLDDHT